MQWLRSIGQTKKEANFGSLTNAFFSAKQGLRPQNCKVDHDHQPQRRLLRSLAEVQFPSATFLRPHPRPVTRRHSSSFLIFSRRWRLPQVAAGVVATTACHSPGLTPRSTRLRPRPPSPSSTCRARAMTPCTTTTANAWASIFGGVLPPHTPQ